MTPADVDAFIVLLRSEETRLRGILTNQRNNYLALQTQSNTVYNRICDIEKKLINILEIIDELQDLKE